ncbi:MAG: HutD family protein [Proteobacteria bacterium]|nr:HutD family protein [Pseudomonadota bacterium]
MTPEFERYDLARIAAQPWKNGAGLTREIAVHPPGAGLADFAWRISVAEVARDAPFSAFPGIDRCIVLLSGSGMRLVAADGVLQLDRPLVPLRFPGEPALDAELLGGPCRDFNVMTRRGLWRSDVTRVDAEGSIAGDAAGALLCVAGTWRVSSDIELAPGTGLLWRAPIDALQVAPSSADATLLHVRLCDDRRP